MSAEEETSVLDDATLHDLSATPSTENTGFNLGLTKSSNKKKRRRLALHLPCTPETKSADHLASDETIMGNNLGVRQSVTSELCDYVIMKPGSMGSGGTSPGLTMEDYYKWEIIQDLFRAPPGAVLTTTCVDGHEIEECKVINPILMTPGFFWFNFVQRSG